MFGIFRRSRSRVVALSAALTLSVPVVARATRAASHPTVSPPVAELSGEGFWEITKCSACLAGAFANALIGGSTPAANAARGGDFLACEMACLQETIRTL